MTKSLAWIVCAISLLTAAAFATIGCGGETGKPKTGYLGVCMVDSSDPKIPSLYVRFDSIDLYNTQKGWQHTITIPVVYDLVRLGLIEIPMCGNPELPVGNYEELRMVISEAWISDSDGDHPVEITGNSGFLGFRFKPGTVVEENRMIDLIVDFNVEKSIVKDGDGNYRLQPVVSCVAGSHRGGPTIEGLITDGQVPLSKASVVAAGHQPGTGSYTAQTVEGDVERDGADDTGKFKIWTVKDGVYDVTINWTDPNNPSRKLSATVPDVVLDHTSGIYLGTVVLTPQGN